MQTFLPYPDFVASARCLDYRRLGKQRVEVLQLVNSLLETTGWSNHPASAMWRGHLGSLINYGVAVCNEWRDRGYKDTVGMRLSELRINVDLWDGAPSWLGRESFHAAHRSNLLRKDPHWYSQFGWKESNDLPYEWPKPDLPEFRREVMVVPVPHCSVDERCTLAGGHDGRCRRD